MVYNSPMRVSIVANASQWPSWPSKIEAIKAFYAPLVGLDIDIQNTDFQNIPLKSYPGTVTSFVNGKAVDTAGTDIEIDQEWFAANIAPLASGYDIVVFQAANVAQTGLPLGVKFGEINGTWCCETFATQETESYYLPGNAASMGANLGDLATVIIEHEIAHALYSISGQTDRTHEFFYANQFSRVLTDIVLPNASTISKLYQQVIALLEQELGIIKQQHSTADMNTPTSPGFPVKITAWASAIAKEEGANPALNNPGNLKVSTLTVSWGAEKGPAAQDGGYLAKFATLEAGSTALCNFLVLGCEDELIAFHAPEARTLGGFTKIYAGNPPQGYIMAIAAAIGEPETVLISTFLS